MVPLQVDGRSKLLGQNLLFWPCKLRLRLSVEASLRSSSLQCLDMPRTQLFANRLHRTMEPLLEAKALVVLPSMWIAQAASRLPHQ